MVAMAGRWLMTLSRNRVTYSIQYHADQDLEVLRRFWGETLGIDGSAIRVQRKSNSGRLNGRSWRSELGVLTVCTDDTLLRARLQAWIDRLRQEGWLHSAPMRGA
jgi:hypothetical protein